MHVEISFKHNVLFLNFSHNRICYSESEKALTTGSYNSGCQVTTETYDFVTDQWTDQADYPFAT